jgi:membrane-bound serine protease (ClpP class)
MLRIGRLPLSLAFIAAGLLSAAAGFAAPAKSVYVIPIDGVIDEGMAHMVQRAVAEADKAHPSAIVLDVNTPGGLVSAAFEIRDALFGAKEPVVAYVSQRAYSAGALVTLAAGRIVMAPGASIGAAEPIPRTDKMVSALAAEFASTAARNHRSPVLARAMVDKNVDANAFKKPGSILTLTSEEAQRAGIADSIAPTFNDALVQSGLSGATVTRSDYHFGEWLARFATSPEVSGLLLSIGVMGLIIEMQTLHGIAGLVGVGALGLFFGTHVYAGFSDTIVIVIALAGIVAILVELHVLPGHGVPGIIGAVLLLAAILMAFNVAFFFVAVQSIAIAIVLSVLTIWGAQRIWPESAFMRRVAFTGVQGADYVAAPDFGDLLGHVGHAASYLRPAGVANVDGRRIDVLTEGDFVPAGSPVRVTRVEGARIFVAPVPSEVKELS